MAHPRPGTHRADVEVDERRARTRVPADAAALHLHADGPDLVDRSVGQVEVHRLAEHVLAELGHRLGAAAQHRVGAGRAVGGDDVDRLVRADLPVGLPHGVEQARVHLGRLVDAPVAQEPVELLQGRPVVAPVAAERDGGALLGVGVEDRERAGVAVGDRILRAGRRGQGQHDPGEAEHDAAETGAVPGGRSRSRSQHPHDGPHPLPGPARGATKVNARLPRTVNVRLSSPRAGHLRFPYG